MIPASADRIDRLGASAMIPHSQSHTRMSVSMNQIYSSLLLSYRFGWKATRFERTKIAAAPRKSVSFSLRREKSMGNMATNTTPIFTM